jgi:hypothetical protein
MTRKKSGQATAPVATPLPTLPYRIRFGPWARNLYLGVPACLALGAAGWSADFTPWVAAAVTLPLLAVMLFCLLPRDITFTPQGTVLVSRRLLGFVPVYHRAYPLSDFKGIAYGSASYSFVGSPSVAAGTLSLVRKQGAALPLQSVSDGAADVRPSVDELMRVLPRLTGLGLLR